MEKIDHFTDKAKRDYLLLRDALDNGNQKAYAQLMSYYRDPIYYLLLKMIKNPYDAEDLTIEAFGKAFRNLDRYTVVMLFLPGFLELRLITVLISFVRKIAHLLVLIRTFVPVKIACKN
jgi:RNA polymerase sigma-70 factor (ECF subfamily)